MVLFLYRKERTMKMFFGNFLRALRGSLEDRSWNLLKTWFALTFPKWEVVDASLKHFGKYLGL